MWFRELFCGIDDMPESAIKAHLSARKIQHRSATTVSMHKSWRKDVLHDRAKGCTGNSVSGSHTKTHVPYTPPGPLEHQLCLDFNFESGKWSDVYETTLHGNVSYEKPVSLIWVSLFMAPPGGVLWVRTDSSVLVRLIGQLNKSNYQSIIFTWVRAVRLQRKKRTITSKSPEVMVLLKFCWPLGGWGNNLSTQHRHVITY